MNWVLFWVFYGTYQRLTLPIAIDAHFPKLFLIDYKVLPVCFTQKHVNNRGQENLSKIETGKRESKAMVSVMIPRGWNVRESQVSTFVELNLSR